uniref:Uncharacterized protein n=1 Tax=Oryza sativa subsp. japonica TaxID=39947 RepID=Q6UUE4_ORYSJ|nr:hypothetical protein OSJNBa0024A05.6 [Oryza sativa Japonica Group]
MDRSFREMTKIWLNVYGIWEIHEEVLNRLYSEIAASKSRTNGYSGPIIRRYVFIDRHQIQVGYLTELLRRGEDCVWFLWPFIEREYSGYSSIVGILII